MNIEILARKIGGRMFNKVMLLFIVINAVIPAYALDVIKYRGREGVIREAGNGVGIVGIERANARGVSRNEYERLDVSEKGIIFNNSANDVDTQLGGEIEGNRLIEEGKEASIIVNEVSSKRSELKGMMEVAGKRSDLIIANSRGIVCDGCGFINVGKGVLTTGVMLFNDDGSVKGYRVEKAEIEIGRNGLRGEGINRVDIIANRLKLEGEIRGKEVVVSLGRQDANYKLVAINKEEEKMVTTRYQAISSNIFGGIYGENIRLLSSENGLGVKIDFNMISSAGNIDIDVNGHLSLVGNGGDINNKVKSNGNISISGSTTTLSSTINSKGEINIDSRYGLYISNPENAEIIGHGIKILSRYIHLKDGARIFSETNLVAQATIIKIGNDDYISKGGRKDSIIEANQSIFLVANNITINPMGCLCAETSTNLIANSYFHNDGFIYGGEVDIKVSKPYNGDGIVVRKSRQDRIIEDIKNDTKERAYLTEVGLSNLYIDGVNERRNKIIEESIADKDYWKTRVQWTYLNEDERMDMIKAFSAKQLNALGFNSPYVQNISLVNMDDVNKGGDYIPARHEIRINNKFLYYDKFQYVYHVLAHENIHRIQYEGLFYGIGHLGSNKKLERDKEILNCAFTGKCNDLDFIKYYGNTNAINYANRPTEREAYYTINQIF